MERLKYFTCSIYFWVYLQIKLKVNIGRRFITIISGRKLQKLNSWLVIYYIILFNWYVKLIMIFNAFKFCYNYKSSCRFCILYISLNKPYSLIWNFLSTKYTGIFYVIELFNRKISNYLLLWKSWKNGYFFNEMLENIS